MIRMIETPRFALPGLAALAFAAMTPSANAADPTGTWLTEAGTSRIRIADCGSALCGNIVWMKEPIDPETKKPRVDKMNPEAALRTRPMMGVAIVIGMRPSGAHKWSGQVYNAEDGKTYSGSITMVNAGALKLEGCALAGLICKAQTWTRVN
jgi:uncharacterized protein (DUF2147 family)